MDYWRECISEAFDDAKITATEEQIATVASWIEGAHDNFGLATGRDCIPNPQDTENKRLEEELEKLREELRTPACRECRGTGRLGESARAQTCYVCDGKGRVWPR